MNKRLIICSDGTWNAPDQKERGKYNPTNVTKMARAIKPVSSDSKQQVVFYDWGIGADQRGVQSWLTAGLCGIGIDKNILDAYRFIIHNYIDGDEIFLFGFSRGAYTVRSLVGLIRNSGILKKIHLDKIEKAYGLYRNDLHPDSDPIKEFRKKYSREAEVKFIGVWDTVGSLGIPITTYRWLAKNIVRWLNRRYEFHDVELSKIVKNAYHALAIDERRNPFRPSLWKNKPKPGQKIEQVWFSGVHGDVGGGYVDDRLGSITFMWMKEKAESCGLEFDEEYIKSTIFPDAMGEQHESYTLTYRLLGEYLRQIGVNGDTNESVHATAVDRYKNYTPPYNPRNLKEYFQKLKKYRANSGDTNCG
jgi:uncharacterized protein (DUF2235 family)